MSSDYAFTDEMAEVSGLGDTYEEACREMVVAGAEWLDENPDADLEFSKPGGVVGMVRAENGESERLMEVMAQALDEMPTGAMVEASVMHILKIDRDGWDEYKRFMESDE